MHIRQTPQEISSVYA